MKRAYLIILTTIILGGLMGCGRTVPTSPSNGNVQEVKDTTGEQDSDTEETADNETPDDTAAAEEFVPEKMYSISKLNYYGKEGNRYISVSCEDYGLSWRINTEYQSIAPATDGYYVVQNDPGLSFYSYDSNFDRVPYNGDIYIAQDKLVPEREYEDFKSLKEFIINEKSVSTDDIDMAYDDFNNDGQKELFLAEEKNGEMACQIYYTDGETVWETIWDDSMQEHDYGVYADFVGTGINVYTVNDKKIFKYSYNIMSSYGIVFYLEVEDNTPKRVDGLMNESMVGDVMVFNTWRFTNDELIGYNHAGEPFAISDYLTSKMYPIVCENGKFGECAYTTVSEDEFKQMKNADKAYEVMQEAVNGIDGFSVYRLTSYDVKVKDSVVDSILFNDEGLIAFNCTLDTEINIYDEETGEFEYKDDPVVSEMGPLSYLNDMDGNEIQTDIEKMVAHVYIKYEDGEFSAVGYEFGVLEETSGQLNVIKKSDFGKFLEEQK